MSNRSQKPTDDLIDLATNVANERDESSGTVEVERRDQERHTYTDPVALVLLNPSGEQSKPIIVRARDISVGGICVVARHMIHVGSSGVIQLLRSDGKLAFVGVKVRYCQYVGKMKHHVGMQFVPIPHELSKKSFVDDDGNLVLLKRSSSTEERRQG